MILHILTLLGGISVFIFGLKTISENAERLAAGKIEKTLKKFVANPVGGLAVGAVASAITQSSTAVNMLTVGFASGGSIPFYDLAAVVMGANIGTTATAQIISFSGLGGAQTGIFFAFLGLIAGLFKNKTVKHAGLSLVGMGLLFAGLAVMGDEITAFEHETWFRAVFLTDNGALLFFSGILLTAVTQSSSGVTGVMILLAGKGMMDFGGAAFMILGTNIGSCFAVIIASMNKSDSARCVAWFNLFFNVFGAILFIPFLTAFKEGITRLFMGGGNAGRAIANFHTVFNLLSALIALPLLKPLSALVEKTVKSRKKPFRRAEFAEKA